MKILDATDAIPRRRRYPKRGDIRRIYVHHSGRAGAPGLQGAKNTARYVVQQRNFPGAAYHYWLPYDEAVVYQLNDDDRRTWHTGGRANTHGISVCLQGNTTRKPISSQQRRSLAYILALLQERYASTLWQPAVSWHSEAGKYGGKQKQACPGKSAVALLERLRINERVA